MENCIYGEVHFKRFLSSTKSE